MIGLTTGSGPVSFAGNTSTLETNPNSWTKLGHVLYIDQPVGTGFSTASTPYPVHDIHRVTSDFHKWLQSFFALFPHLQSKRVHLLGESYAGFYIPYFASAIMDNQDSFPLRLQSVSIGDGTIGEPAAMSSLTIGTFLQSQGPKLHIPEDVLAAFSEADETCGFDTIVQHANTTFPLPLTHPLQIPGNPDDLESEEGGGGGGGTGDIDGSCTTHPHTADAVLSAIVNSTCGGSCATFATAVDYLQTASAAGTGHECFDMYDVTNDCNAVSPFAPVMEYFSRADVQTALNVAPPPPPAESTPFKPCNELVLTTLSSSGPLPFPPTHSILPSMVTTHNLSLHVYSGENDLLLNHFGTELVLQNMTWGGARGFAQKPSRVFYVDDAAPSSTDSHEESASTAGVWGSERGVSYHLFHGAGHSVFAKKPREMFSFVRDVVVGK